MAAAAAAAKPHAIMVEFLFQGHITPFVHLAKSLASKGCTVTYIRTEYTHHLMSTSTPLTQSPDSLFSAARESGLDIHCTTVSDGFPLDYNRWLNFVDFYQTVLRDFPGRIDEVVGKIVAADRQGGGGRRPFLVADALYLWPTEVAAKHGIPNVAFWTSTAVKLSLSHHMMLLYHNGLLKNPGDYKNYLNDIPGVKARSIIDHMEWAKYGEFVPQMMKDSMMKACLQVNKADFVLCNTVQELECDAISGLKEKLPAIYAIGPTNFSTKISTPESLRPATDCNEWLSDKPRCSVLFVSFGSVSQIYKEAIKEISHGLKLSGAYYLLVLRPDQDDPEFASERGHIVPWCNQKEVLANPAIGGFLTHCGWNSLLESMWFGVPLICYPLMMDQPVNRNMIVDELRIGINLCDKEHVSKEEVAEKVRGFMTSSEELIRSEMEKVRKTVHGALGANGSSDTNLEKFIQNLKDKICS